MKVKVTLQSVDRRFRTHFGTTSNVCSIIWKKIYDDATTAQELANAKPEHLLWSLLFLKTYTKEPIHSSLVDCDDKTFRKWSWKFVKAISELHDDYVSIVQCLYNHSYCTKL